nr:ribonuclease H protein [Tanacetum cinerariifolium]
MLKLNTDGSSKGNPGPSSFGCLIRDCKGRWICGYMGKIKGKACTAFETELWSVYKGLCLIKEKNMSNLFIETDWEAVMRLGWKEADNDHPLKSIMDDITKMMKEQKCVMLHTRRDGNQCADHMARLASSSFICVTKSVDFGTLFSLLTFAENLDLWDWNLMEVKGFNGLCLVGWINVFGVKDLGIWVGPLSARSLTGEASSSAALATVVTTSLSTTFAQINLVPSMLSTKVPPSPMIIFEEEELDTASEDVLAPLDAPYPLLWDWALLLLVFKIEERMRKKRDKIIQSKTGSAIPMQVIFNKFEFNSSFIWIEFYHAPLDKDIKM